MRSRLLVRLTRLEDCMNAVVERSAQVSPLRERWRRRQMVERGVSYEEAMAENRAGIARMMAGYQGDGSYASVLRHCRQVRHLERQRAAV